MWNSKPKKSGHKCRKRTFGNPKIGDGICNWGVRVAVDERISGKRQVKAWLEAVLVGVEPDDIEL